MTAHDGARIRGTCFGFEIISALPFRFLRSGAGTPLEIRALSSPGIAPYGRLVQEWAARPGRSLHARLFKEADRYLLWLETEELFIVEPEIPRITVPESDDPIRGEAILWGIPASILLLHYGHLPLHAAAVEVGGAAILLAAPGGFGKTTLAASFHGAGYRLLSEDIACILPRLPLSVIPGPAMLRVRTDVIDHLTLAQGEIVSRSETRVTLALDHTARGGSEPVPIRAVVFLRAGERVEIAPVTLAAGIADLWALSQRDPDPDALARCFQGVVSLANQVPMWNLYRPMKFDALEETRERIIRVCGLD